MGKINFLDCTLRDGGYYNSWDFEFKAVNEYLKAVKNAGVHVAEIGFRSLKNDEGFKGASAFTTDDYIQTLSIPSGLSLAVMINASELLYNFKIDNNAFNKLIPKRRKGSSLDTIRIACHFDEFKAAIKCTDRIKKRGYRVGINLMQIGDRTIDEITEAAKLTNLYNPDVLYFADSLGNMNNSKVIDIIKTIRSHWKGDVGIHAHDNMSMAISNSLTAIKNGANWIDSTITGMGRGPGNAQTELIAFEISELNKKKCDIVPLNKLINKYFNDLKNHYKWGTNSFYYLSGKHGIHPSYIQEMLSDKRYSDNDIINAINQLKIEGGKSFSRSKLVTIKNPENKIISGTWSPKKTLSQKDVFLIGPGETTKKHIEAIKSFIRRNKLLIFAINNEKVIPEKYIDFRIVSHPLRIISDIDDFKKIKTPLIAPLNSINKNLKNSLSKIKINNFGIKIEKDIFKFKDKSCVIPNPLVLSYFLAVVSSGNVNKVYMSGFDGYRLGDPRKLEVDKVFDLFNQSKSKVNLVSVTPTLYNINTKSIYSL